jgi:predicted phage tail protein
MMNTPAEAAHLAAPVARTADESLPELTRRLADDFKLLARQEAELAKRELTEKLSQAARQAVQLALGAGALLFGLLVLLAAGVLALATIMPAWAAALLIGGALSLLGIVLVLSGKTKLSRIDLKPQQAVESVRQDVAALKKAAE